MHQNEDTLYDIRLAMRRADYRRAMREKRRKFWRTQGGGQLFCYVYLPEYPKELLEVYDWRPVTVADPAFRQAKALIEEADRGVAD